LSFSEGSRTRPAPERPRRSGTSTRRTRGPAGGPGDRGTDQQTLLVRRVVAIGAGVLLVLLLVFGINSCLGARKDRAFRNYASDERALVRGSQAVSKRLFETLSKPSGGDALDIQTQVNAERVDAEQLVQRARSTDHPGELDASNDWLVTALQFRSDAIATIADRLPTALGDKGREPAIRSIAGQMQALLASDVVYLQRAIPALNDAYDKRDINEEFPAVRFLPNLGWLDPATVDDRLSRLTGSASEAATPGPHGTGLQGVVAQPAGTELSESGINRIAAGDQLAFDVKVQDQGQAEETDVGVTITIQDGKRISVDQTIPRIAAGATETVSIPITQAPETGAVSTLTVNVAPVPGEGTKDNNKASYQVVFTQG
jgi:CARDB protein